jgi:hypothetical protein
MTKRTMLDEETNGSCDGRKRGLIRISAKALGELALPTFCARCFWIKRKLRNKLPFRQPLPGVFSTIDSITKQVVHGHFDEYGRLPPWLAPIGEVVRYHEPPHWSRFNTVIEEHGILLTGAADGIFERADGSFVIVDYKTARFTPAQDALLPMYEVQLNVYALIAKHVGFVPVSRLYLVYMEPSTDQSARTLEHYSATGLNIGFAAHVLGVRRKRDLFDPLLARVREIDDGTAPPSGRTGCQDCLLTERLTEVLRAARRAGQALRCNGAGIGGTR